MAQRVFMSAGDLIPDRRRNHFPRNGGPRPTAVDKDRARDGIAAARAVLSSTVPPKPNTVETIVKRLTPEQIVRARQGIAAARSLLQNPDTPEPDTPEPDHSARAA